MDQSYDFFDEQMFLFWGTRHQIKKNKYQSINNQMGISSQVIPENRTWKLKVYCEGTKPQKLKKYYTYRPNTLKGLLGIWDWPYTWGFTERNINCTYKYIAIIQLIYIYKSLTLFHIVKRKLRRRLGIKWWTFCTTHIAISKNGYWTTIKLK